MVPSPSRSALLFQVKWVCASHSPDIRVRPRPSMTRAPSALAGSTAPTAGIRAFSTGAARPQRGDPGCPPQDRAGVGVGARGVEDAYVAEQHLLGGDGHGASPLH